MKIIQVCPRFLPHIGGVETHVHEIAKRLSKGKGKGNEVIVYATDPSGKLPEEEVIDGIKVKRFKSYAPNEAFFFSPKLYLALRKESCDVLHIHCFQAFPAFLAYLAMKKNRMRKMIFTPHYHPKGGTLLRTMLRKIYDKVQEQIFFKADKIICVSEYERRMLHKKFNIPMRKLVHIPNGIEAEKFEKLSKIRSTDLNKFRILYVGRLEKYKRVQWLLASLKRLIAKFPLKKVRLVIVGKGPYKEELVKLSKMLEMRENVEFKQDLTSKQLLNEYCKCNVFVMPSEYEAFSIVTLEALACGRPAIVAKVGGLPELVSKEFLFNDQNSLDTLLSRVLEHRIEAGAKFDLQKYSWDSIVRQHLKIYNGGKIV